jgi:hypothetical protein
MSITTAPRSRVRIAAGLIFVLAFTTAIAIIAISLALVAVGIFVADVAANAEGFAAFVGWVTAVGMAATTMWSFEAMFAQGVRIYLGVDAKLTRWVARGDGA